MNPMVEIVPEDRTSKVVEGEDEVARRVKRDMQKQMTIIGRGGCGKTSILQRMIYSKFSENIPATPIESETISYDMDGKKVTLKIFDTSGQDDYSRFRALTLPISDYVLICFSVDDSLSHSEVSDTIHFLVKDKVTEKCKVLLCATKIDLRRRGSVTEEEGKLLKDRIGAVAYFECSAKTGEGVRQIFDFIRDDIYRTYVNPRKGFLNGLFCCC